MSGGEGLGRVPGKDSPGPAFLVFDTESVPDGKLLQLVKYPNEQLTPEEAILRAQAEARASSPIGSDFLPVTFQYPIAASVMRLGSDFRIQTLTCLDAPQFRPREIVNTFWKGVNHYNGARLVTFNGRGFDLPLMELMAFRYGCVAMDYFQRSRNRYNGHLDLYDWLSNFGGSRMVGGLNLLSKILGKPGKMEITGDQVYAMYREGKIQEINDYCMFDTLDTYFVFLRTRVLTGELNLEQERALSAEAKAWLGDKVNDLPVLQRYLDSWAEWEPWP
jgi:predicted PolB exonuclease-like 3'-5' exonuclease